MAIVKRGNEYTAIIDHWCDGDTVQILYNCNECRAWHQVYLRIRNIDSYEPKGEQADLARSTAVTLNKLTSGHKVKVIFTQGYPEKHGRLVGDIIWENGFISDWLVRQNLSWYRSSPQT